MGKTSAGILLFRIRELELEVLLVHPGGPFWKNKDDGAWSIPKGGYEPPEDALAAAQREFEEETGTAVDGDFIPLGDVKQSGSKIVRAWALLHDFDPTTLKSNSFEMEWPPSSNRMMHFPEVDRASWFAMDVARTKILKAQEKFLDRLAAFYETRARSRPSVSPIA